MKKTILFIGISIITFTGCSIKQEVKPLTLKENTTEVCIEENKAVREGFLKAYKEVVEEKGYKVKLLEKDAPLNSCKLVSTYVANWTWDLAMYLVYAEIKIYNNTKLAGEAIYDARQAGGRLDKFISADKKVRELVNQLFPNLKSEPKNLTKKE